MPTINYLMNLYRISVSTSNSKTKLWIRIGLILFIIFFCDLNTVSAKRKVWKKVEAVIGKEAVLPCKVGTIQEEDMIYVVLWYQNGREEPIYSYDNRPRELQAMEDRHIIQSQSLEGRVFFKPGPVPALHIRAVSSADQANYTCRVDFRIANSRATYLSLRVIIPPLSPVLVIGGHALYHPILGPLREGQAFRISCLVEGGQPPPHVIWIKDNKVIDRTTELQSPLRTANQLIVPALPRSFHNSRLTCEAFNTNLTAPVSTSISITMNLRPLLVSILFPPKQMRIGETYEVKCLTAGSRPSSNVTWTLGNVASVISIPAVTEHDTNSSLSTARLRVARQYHGQKLTCAATNPLFPSHVLMDSILLNVTYPPVVALELGGGLKTIVKEGTDVYFNCMVDSNPPTYKTRWYHKNERLHHSPEKGILIGGHSLALRGIKRNQGGHYVCSASNIEGDANSLPLFLDISFAPICALPKPHSSITTTSIGHAINVTCEVLSSPSDVKYSWVFNNTVTSERVTGNRVYLTKDGRSVVQFMPRTTDDYGTFQCWAENSVGRMKTPCFYHVLPAGPPNTPVNCTVANKTYDSLVVSCEPGFDGGIKQEFEAWVFESVTGRSQLNESSKLPFLILRGLTPGLDYVIKVAARNSLGISELVRLEAFTYKMAENRMKNNKRNGEGLPESVSVGGTEGGKSAIILVALIIGTVLLVGITTSFVFLLRNNYCRTRANGGGQQFSPTSESCALTTRDGIQLRVKQQELTEGKKLSSKGNRIEEAHL